ncbi:hypothetical protein Tco_1345892 [Tanacetum coccineum]
MTSPVIDLVSRPDSPNVHWPLPTTITTTAAPPPTTNNFYTTQPNNVYQISHSLRAMGELEQHIANLDIDRKINETVKEVVISSVKHAMRAPLRARFKDLPTSDMKEIMLQRMLEENYDKGHMLEHERAFEDCRANLIMIISSKTAASAEYFAWTTTDTQIKPSITLIPDDLYMDDETTIVEQAVSSDDEVGRDHIPMVNLRQSWWKPLTEDRPATPEPAWTIPSSDMSMPTNNWASTLKSTHVPLQENSLLAQTGDMATFMDWFCKQRGISELTPKDLEGPAFEIVKVFHPDVIHLQFQMEECHKLLTDQVDDAILRPALSISKMKAAYYPNVGLEQLVTDQFWIAEECKYDIAAMSLEPPITRRQKDSIYRCQPMDQKLGYQTRVDDFQLGLRLPGQLNLTKPRWEATGFEFKHDYIVIDSPRAVTFRDRYGVQMITYTVRITRLIADIEDKYHGPSDTLHNPP